jgi:hypothetical protein
MLINELNAQIIFEKYLWNNQSIIATQKGEYGSE